MYDRVVEIKELVPKSKEIIVNTKNQQGVFYDTFFYTIPNQPRNGNINGNGSPREISNVKSYLYIVSQIQSGDSSLDYVPNLIASFIKREIESSNYSPDGENQSFENSLKKTNELVEGLIKDNNDIKLDLGVALITKEKMTLSKIGKVKMLA